MCQFPLFRCFPTATAVTSMCFPLVPFLPARACAAFCDRAFGCPRIATGPRHRYELLPMGAVGLWRLATTVSLMCNFNPNRGGLHKMRWAPCAAD